MKEFREFHEFHLEEELAAAMRDRAVRHRPGTYDAAVLVRRVRRRRRRLRAVVAAAATVVAVSLGAGFAAQLGRDRDRDTASVPASPSPSSDGRTSASASASASASPPPVTSEPPSDPAATAGALFLAAVRYQDPATRAQVNLAEVAGLFADEKAYQRIWGTGARGVTCGAEADGALVAGSVFLYRGAERLARTAVPEFDPSSGKVTGVTCAAAPAGGKGADSAVSGFYGGLVAAAKAGDSTARAGLARQFLSPDLRAGQKDTAGICSSHAPTSWVATDPTAGTLTHGWTITLSDGGSFPVEIDENGKIDKSCGA
ncbi:hypothetical protein HHL19_10490 [Streptomyces sp. R302]|uniref:hypothetical protein n=1 Tax=unclassified Streptomyces TaxID=2593676 RepID=UPI00145D90A7|nr:MULTISPECIES: hypothetical protein [unclassified Streptomyces]NML50096.1 hypothetical protein [Streptomyces sp. R301]NML79087.1 hypothetical protein [Streptomyces sp. R302]